MPGYLRKLSGFVDLGNGVGLGGYKLRVIAAGGILTGVPSRMTGESWRMTRKSSRFCWDCYELSGGSCELDGGLWNSCEICWGFCHTVQCFFVI